MIIFVEIECKNMRIQDRKFERIDFTNVEHPTEYDNCSFKNCLFAGVSLSNIIFTECHFFECDLSNSKLTNSSLKDATFENCKMLGLRFDECKPFLLEFNFIDCILDFSSFL